jgi:hypothetical protein
LKVPSFASMRKPILFVFGLAMAVFEIVVRFGQDPYVFVFLLMCLGFIPAKSVDEILRRQGGLFSPAKDLIEDHPEPAKDAAP